MQETSGRLPTLVNLLGCINTEEIRSCCSQRIDAMIGDWKSISDCSVTPDASTFARNGGKQSVEGDMTAERLCGEPVRCRVVMAMDDIPSQLGGPTLDIVEA